MKLLFSGNDHFKMPNLASEDLKAPFHDAPVPAEGDEEFIKKIFSAVNFRRIFLYFFFFFVNKSFLLFKAFKCIANFTSSGLKDV